MIDTRGMITVAEAAKRLNRSIEQVRRNLREGKLKGQRVGNQWFVDEACLVTGEGEIREFETLIPRDVIDEIDRLRNVIYRRTGRTFDAVQLVHESREDH